MCPLPRSPPALQAPSPPAGLHPRLLSFGDRRLTRGRQCPSQLRFASPCGRVTLSARVPTPAHLLPSASVRVPGLLCDRVVGILLPSGVCSGCIWDTDPYQIFDLQIFSRSRRRPLHSVADAGCCVNVRLLGCFSCVCGSAPAPHQALTDQDFQGPLESGWPEASLCPPSHTGVAHWCD